MIEHYLFLLCALIFTTSGQLLFRYYHIKKRIILLCLTLLSFILVPYFSYNALIGLSIDIVYMATSVTIVLVLMGGYFLLGEKLNKNQIIGSLIIISGVIIYNL